MALVLAWPGALVIGLTLGLMGSGGSILTVPVLIYLLGQEEKLAIAGSLAIVGMISLAASIPYIRDRLVDWRSVFMFGIPGMIGTYFGAWSSAWVDGSVQLMVFAGVMLGASWMMLRRQPLQASADTPRLSDQNHRRWSGRWRPHRLRRGRRRFSGGAGAGTAGRSQHAPGHRHQPGHHCGQVSGGLL